MSAEVPPSPLFDDAPTDPVDRLIWRLSVHGVLCAGRDAASVRKAILDAGVQTIVYGRGDQIRCASYGDRFAEVFGEPLVPKAKGRRK